MRSLTQKPLIEPAAQLLRCGAAWTCHLCSAAGFLVGFDKFMNLLLKDVEEVYTVMVQASLRFMRCVTGWFASEV